MLTLTALSYRFILREVTMCNNRNCTHKPHHPVTHCIFDLDGTLLDTEKAYEQIIVEMLRERGIEYTAELRRKVLGTTSDHTWRILSEELPMKSEATNTLLQEFRERCYDVIGNCPIMPGGEKLVRHLYSHGIPIAIATSSRDDTYRYKTKIHQEFFKIFHHVVCGGSDPEVKLGKPNPDIFLICAQRFNENPCPEDCLVFEDSVNGVVAARKAGMQCVAIPNEGIPRIEFKPATLIINSLEEFVPENFGLPCYFTK